MNGQGNGPSTPKIGPEIGDDKNKKQHNFKLIVDPAIHKGQQKLYRFDGVIPGDPLSKVIVTDPRERVTRILSRPKQHAELPVPQFKVDEHYVGIPPPREVTFVNLNDNINSEFLRNMIKDIGKVDECSICYHPSNGKHIGIAKVVFELTRCAKMCVEKFNQTTKMGNVMTVFVDPLGKDRQSYIDEKVYGVPRQFNEYSYSLEDKDSSMMYANNTAMPPNNHDSMFEHSVSNINEESTHESSLQYANASSEPVTNNSEPDMHNEYHHHYGNSDDRTADSRRNESFNSRDSSYHHDKSDYHHRHDLGRDRRSDNWDRRRDRKDYRDRDYQSNRYDDRNRERNHSYRDKNSRDYRDSRYSKDKYGRDSRHDHHRNSQSDSHSSERTRDKTRNDDRSYDRKTSNLSKSDKRPRTPTEELVDETDLKEESTSQSAFESSSKTDSGTLDLDSRIQLMLNQSRDFSNFATTETLPDPSGTPVHDEDTAVYPAPPPVQIPQLFPPQPPNMIDSSYNGHYPPPLPGRVPNYPPPSQIHPPHPIHGMMPMHLPVWPPQYPLPPPHLPPDPGYQNFMDEESAYYAQAEPEQVNYGDAFSAALEDLIEDLKSIINKDLFKKINTHVAFNFFDNWWQNSQNQTKDLKSAEDSEETKASSIKTEAPSAEIQGSSSATTGLSTSAPLFSLSSLFEGSGLSSGASFLGMKAGLSKMPSFRRKVSPSREQELKQQNEERNRKYGQGEQDEPHTNDKSKIRKPIPRRGSVSTESETSSSESSESEQSESSVSDDSDADEEYLPRKDDSQSSSASSESETEESEEESESSSTSSESASEEEDKQAKKQKLPRKAPPIKSKSTKTAVTSVDESSEDTRDDYPSADIMDILKDIKEKDVEKLEEMSASLDHNYCRPPEEAPDYLSSKNKKTKFANDSTSRLQDITSRVSAKGNRELDKLLQSLPADKLAKGSSPSRFLTRDNTKEQKILREYSLSGVDEEDLYYFRQSYDKMINTDDKAYEWCHDTVWLDHCVTNIPDPCQPPASKRSKKFCPDDLSNIRKHCTGCARTEGYYKISAYEKSHYMTNARQFEQKDAAEKATAEQVKATAQNQLREARSHQRRLATAFGDLDTGELLKFNQLKFRKKLLRFSRSKIHDWGLVACESIPVDTMVIEYVGAILRHSVADEREKHYERTGIGSSYLFRIDGEFVIDATKCGNLARFVNHSCDPNCYARVITVDGAKKIVIYSRRRIEINEEITYDYKFPYEDEKIPCLCGASTCRGFLN